MKHILFFMMMICSIFAEEVRDPNTNVSFPSEVSFSQDGKEYRLNCTGVATRKKFFVKVYSIAHYMQKGELKGDIFQQILQDNLAKQFQIKWLLDAPASKVIEGYRESFKNTLGDKLKSEIDAYLQFFNHDVKKGEEQIIRWLPGGDVQVMINGKQMGHIVSKEFAEGLWSIWFGPKSVVDRNRLVSLII